MSKKKINGLKPNRIHVHVTSEKNDTHEIINITVTHKIRTNSTYKLARFKCKSMHHKNMAFPFIKNTQKHIRNYTCKEKKYTWNPISTTTKKKLCVIKKNIISIRV